MVQLSYCAEQVRRFDNDRFICSLFAPPEQREAMAAAHAFSIEVARIREIVTEPILMQMRLQWWRDAVDAIYAKQAPQHQVALAMAAAVDRYQLDRGYFDRILRARTLDLKDESPDTLEALVGYARDTSAALAELSAHILCTESDNAREAARDVGIAWALTGILRAIPFHARSRRIYLPADLIRQAGLDVMELFERGNASGLSEVVSKIAETAEHYLISARGRRQEIPKRALPALLPATIAGVYLAQLAKSKFDPSDSRVQTSSPVRLLKVAFNQFRGTY